MEPRRLGTIGVVGASFWVLAVLALHVLDSDLDPIDTYVPTMR